MITDEMRERAERMAQSAEEAGASRCRFCDSAVFSLPAQEAIRKGHIYSPAGEREFGISGTCEHCFDRVTLPPDEDDNQPPLGGD